jgi:glycosyltransferase involved in cell wall biosynthesis
MNQDSNKKKPIVYFGRLAESKGVNVLIEAYYLLYREGLTNPLWIIGGNYEEINHLRQMCISQSIELEENGKIFWWGHVPHQLVPLILKKCSLFCFTSNYEPGGRTILEAMACGLPVIATRCGFAGEIIVDNLSGIIVDENTPQMWAKSIRSIIYDQDKCKTMGQNAKDIVNRCYSLNNFYQKHWQCYLDIYPNI